MGARRKTHCARDRDDVILLRAKAVKVVEIIVVHVATDSPGDGVGLLPGGTTVGTPREKRREITHRKGAGPRALGSG